MMCERSPAPSPLLTEPQQSGKSTNVFWPLVFSLHWHRLRRYEVCKPHWQYYQHEDWGSYCEIPWINYCAHSFSYLVMSAVMTSVSGIWDGYFFNVNFPEAFCMKSFSVSLVTKFNLSLCSTGQLCAVVTWQQKDGLRVREEELQMSCWLNPLCVVWSVDKLTLMLTCCLFTEAGRKIKSRFTSALLGSSWDSLFDLLHLLLSVWWWWTLMIDADKQEIRRTLMFFFFLLCHPESVHSCTHTRFSPAQTEYIKAKKTT